MRYLAYNIYIYIYSNVGVLTFRNHDKCQPYLSQIRTRTDTRLQSWPQWERIKPQHLLQSAYNLTTAKKRLGPHFIWYMSIFPVQLRGVTK